MALIGTLNTAVAGNVIDPDEYNANMDSIRNAFNATAVLTDVARTITVQHTFNPSSVSAPFLLGANATGQMVTGLNADQLDSQEGSFYQNADNLNAGTIPSARVTGAYTGITQVGTLVSLTVTGTATAGALTTAGALNAGSATITGLVHVNFATDEHLRLNHSSATGNPYLSLQQAGTQRAFIQYLNSGILKLNVDQTGGRFEIRAADSGGTEHTIFYAQSDGPWLDINPGSKSGDDEVIRMRGGAAGSPYISFFQAGTERGRVLFSDSADSLYVRTEASTAAVRLAVGGSTRLIVNDSDPVIHIRGATGEQLRLEDSSASGNPFLSFYQTTTRRAFAQFSNSGYLQFNVESASHYYIFRVNDTARLYINSTGLLETFQSGNEGLRLNTASATGSPFITWNQNGTRRAYMQWGDGTTALLIVAEEAASEVRIWAANTLAATFEADGDLVVQGDVYAQGSTRINPIITTHENVNFGASVASEAQATQTVTVTGAASGDHVLIAVRSVEPAGFVIENAVVTAADTITIYVRNESGGAINLSDVDVTTIVFPA